MTAFTDTAVAVGRSRSFSRAATANRQQTADIYLGRQCHMGELSEPHISVEGPLPFHGDVLSAVIRRVRRVVDFRKCPHDSGGFRSPRVTIGTLTYTGDGGVLDHHIQPEYLRPGVNGGGDG